MLTKIWRTPVHRWWKCKMVQPPWKAAWQLLKSLSIHLLYDPSSVALGNIRDEYLYSHKKTYTRMLIAALCTVVKNWEQPILQWVKG